MPIYSPEVYKLCCKKSCNNLLPCIFNTFIVLICLGILALIPILLGAPAGCYNSYEYCFTHITGGQYGVGVLMIFVTLAVTFGITVFSFFILKCLEINNYCIMLTFYILTSIISGIFLGIQFFQMSNKNIRTEDIFNPNKKIDFSKLYLTICGGITTTSVLLLIFIFSVCAIYESIIYCNETLEISYKEVKKEKERRKIEEEKVKKEKEKENNQEKNEIKNSEENVSIVIG